ncbi:MAG: RtcB family protein [Coriobacteriia bacterium]|nr:RtcB family protein [Coriobacteriia bacterium]
MLELKGTYGSAIVFADEVEKVAIDQIITLLDQEFSADSHIRIMPDVHAGAGCTIGTTMTITDKVVPNLVGVDIGCGVLVATLSLTRDEIDLEKLDRLIKKRIPAGFASHDRPIANYLGDIREIRALVELTSKKWNDKMWNRQIGTLGGGNHFIEIAIGQDGTLSLLVHTGSRNLGLQVAEHYQDLAIRKHWRSSPVNGPAIPNDLCYLSGQDRDDYLHDMRICQTLAVANRRTIAHTIFDALDIGDLFEGSIVCDTIHNYVDDDRMLRKGAVSAREGEVLVIPFNMRDGSLLCRGKGNAEWNFSAPHGAGRIMSRRRARKVLDLATLIKDMNDVYSTTIGKRTLDESPRAYKDMRIISDAIGDTVEIIDLLKPIYNFKATD